MLGALAGTQLWITDSYKSARAVCFRGVQCPGSGLDHSHESRSRRLRWEGFRLVSKPIILFIAAATLIMIMSFTATMQKGMPPTFQLHEVNILYTHPCPYPLSRPHPQPNHNSNHDCDHNHNHATASTLCARRSLSVPRPKFALGSQRASRQRELLMTSRHRSFGMLEFECIPRIPTFIPMTRHQSLRLGIAACTTKFLFRPTLTSAHPSHRTFMFRSLTRAT